MSMFRRRFFCFLVVIAALFSGCCFAESGPEPDTYGTPVKCQECGHAGKGCEFANKTQHMNDYVQLTKREAGDNVGNDILVFEHKIMVGNEMASPFSAEMYATKTPAKSQVMLYNVGPWSSKLKGQWPTREDQRRLYVVHIEPVHYFYFLSHFDSCYATIEGAVALKNDTSVFVFGY